MPERKYAEFLGVRPKDYRNGVMQDVHWYADYIGGMFQGYALGNVLAHSSMAPPAGPPRNTGRDRGGRFDILHNWLQTNIYRHGCKYTTLELVERLTGGPIRLEPYKEYLQTKYADIYGIR